MLELISDFWGQVVREHRTTPRKESHSFPNLETTNSIKSQSVSGWLERLLCANLWLNGLRVHRCWLQQEFTSPSVFMVFIYRGIFFLWQVMLIPISDSNIKFLFSQNINFTLKI